MDDEPTTQELRIDQLEHERAERERAKGASTEDEADTHARRAEKAGYLREKLEERERAEREAGA